MKRGIINKAAKITGYSCLYIFATMKQQTAVDFLAECLSIHFTLSQKMQFEGLFQQAKEMEKQQIIESYHKAQLSLLELLKEETMLFDSIDSNDKIDAEQYYKETFEQ